MKQSSRFRIMVFLLMIPLTASAQEQDNPVPGVIVEIEISPEIPTTGAPLLLTLLVDHPVPDEVSVIAPPFLPSIFFDRLVKTPRVTEEQTWTSVEYKFIPNSPGIIILESFTVICPLGTTETGPIVFDVSVADEDPKTQITRIVWEGVPSQITVGESAVFTLRVNGPDLQRLPHGFFIHEVPQGAILEALPLTAEERAGGFAIRFNLIPIESGDFLLPARILHYENIQFAIPSLRIRVTDPPPAELQATEAVTEAVVVPTGNAEAQFPDFDFTVSDKSFINRAYPGQCENIYNTAKYLWDNGLRARALAELRRNERDHPTGALLQPIRRQAEENLGLFNTENESRNLRKFFLGLTIFLFILVIISLFVCFFLLRGFFRRKAAPNRRQIAVFIVVLAALGLFCLYRLTDSQGLNGKNGRFGVVNETPVRRTADYAGEEFFSFREGQPVIILQNSGTWVNVRANEAAGSSGWVPVGAVIFY